jgi:hypothetical protein
VRQSLRATTRDKNNVRARTDRADDDIRAHVEQGERVFAGQIDCDRFVIRPIE